MLDIFKYFLEFLWKLVLIIPTNKFEIYQIKRHPKDIVKQKYISSLVSS